MTARICLALAFISACHKKSDSPAASGSGSSVEASGSATGSATGSAAIATPPHDPAKALDAAIAAKGIAADDVKRRIASATSAWAVVASKKNGTGDIIEFDVLAARGNGVAELPLVAPAGSKPSTFAEVLSLDAKDLDGNGVDEGLLVVEWHRDTTIPGEQKGWSVYTDEEAHELYVLAGAPALRAAFTHLVSYTTHSEGVPEDNPTSYPSDETVTYDWAATPGKPPAIKLTRTHSEVAQHDRLKGVLDPATDPLFAAGSGKDMPVDVH